MKKNFINKKMYFLLLFLIIVMIMSCKKINLLSPTYIPPPTEFPSKDDDKEEIPDYPNPTPLPTPPEEGDIEEKPIEVKPEVVANGTVFGGYGRRFKFKNDWYVLATNEYQYEPNTKTLNPTGKGAVLRIENDGSTITKIHSLSSGSDLEKAEYWTNLNSKKLVITDTEVNIPIKAESQGWATNWDYKIPDNVDNNIGESLYAIVDENGNRTSIYQKMTYEIFGYIEKLIIHYSNRSSLDLLNWNKTSSSNVFDFPKPNFNNPNFQGRFGNAIQNSIIYFKGKIFVFNGHLGIYDEYLTYYIEPRDGYFYLGKNEYYTIEWGKDMSDAKNWVTNHIRNASYARWYNVWYDENKLYVYTLADGKYTYSEEWKLWTNSRYMSEVYTTEDGINWKEESYDIINKYKPTPAGKSYGYVARSDEIINETNKMIGFEIQDGTPFEPSYTELNGKYYRTFNSTYPMPPIKEIMETVDRFETNFTVTEEHIKKSGYYQLQVSSVSPDKAQESDWVNVVPNNKLTSAIGWESGGADLFTFNSKIVRLVDYDRQFKLNSQYETALNLSQKYYALLEASKTMDDYKKYDYYFLYYKAMADMLKIIKDNGSDYFRPDEAVTHYTFEIN
ncbi:hypothetical protein Q5M87_05185 [Brachyspira innocens]|uniref:Uncharacterized protein n=1 Tax=Brachyspira innocens TaxID=13264 RepID=A0ABT8YXN3_9SPIR|nr:hypothetical protein [Brachyspira innocens]MDO6993400.1 hypothetical protein [Brachyspira innocens]MDO7020320.1 hypothetical protein [Brachyspira innocens]